MKTRRTRLLWLIVTAILLCRTGVGAVTMEAEQESTSRTNDITLEVSMFGNNIIAEGEALNPTQILTLSFVVTVGDQIISMNQCDTDAEGKFYQELRLEPALYTSIGALEAELRVGGYDVNTMLVKLPLYTASEIEGVIPAALDVSSLEQYVDFVEEFGDMLAISGLLRNPSVSYELFLDTRPDSLAGMAEVQDWMQKLLTQYDRAMTLLDEMNAASDNAKWAKVQELVTITYRDLLQVDLTAYAGVEDVRALFQRMTGRYYSDLDAIRETYVQACADQLEYEKNNPTQTTTPTSSNRGSSSIRGSSGGGISSVIGNWVSSSASAQTEPADNAQSSVTPEGMVLPEMAFHDLEEVPWAAEAINALRERGIVHGDGTGAFEPMRGVTREEMLSMLLSAFSLPEADPSTETFTDVPANAWFYENVILARSLGMVQGLPDGNFGAGQPVTRADMAVMSGRLLDILGCTPTPTRAAIVFRDYSEIPDYAKEMVSLLQQAGVLNGDTEGNYLPTGSATRAEAAVMLYNLIQIVEG